jgi:CDP-4-dehydro-6-deoxyglucose reductase
MTIHHILVQPSGRQFDAHHDQTVLAAALTAGIVVPYGCRNGSCGACKGRVLAGRVRHGAHQPVALTDEEEKAGLALFCCAHALSDLTIEVAAQTTLDDILPRRMPARIEHIDWPARDVAILQLRLPPSEELRYRAGQYVDFILPSGVRRSYSIASPPGTKGPLEFHIRHMPGGTFTDALFGLHGPAVRERGILRLEGPLGSFHLREDGSAPIVLLASGTGFAPIKAIAETIFAKGINRDDAAAGRRARDVVLYWGARTQRDLYLADLPQRWAAEQPHFRYVPVLSEPLDAAADVPQWTGRTGLVHEALMQDLPDLSGCEVYACGVPAMVRAAHRDFVGRCGLPEESFYSDAFVSSADRALVVAAGA